MQRSNDFHIAAQLFQGAVNAFLVLLVNTCAFLASAEEDLCLGVLLSDPLDGSFADLVVLTGNGSNVIARIIQAVHSKVLDSDGDSGLVSHLDQLRPLLGGDWEDRDAVNALLNQGFHRGDRIFQAVLGI